ncbi:MAG: BatD family protein [Vibrio sp.]
MTRITHTLSLYCSVLLLSLFSLTAYAKGDFYATVSSNKVVQNEVFQLTVTINSRVSSDAINFSVLQKDFQMGQPNFGTSTNIVNGDRSEQSQWTIPLAAKQTGILRIPRFTINGQQTQSIAIQVTKDRDAPNTKDIVEVQSHLSQSTLYPNESAQLKVRLIVKADLRRLQNQTIEPPKVNGMELNPASDPDQHQEVVNGIQVTVVDQNFRVTATKPGTFTLREPKFDGSLVYGGTYGNRTRIVPLTTVPKTYTINVKPKPKDYHGVWLPTSKLSLTQHWQDPDGHTIKNDSVKLKVGDSITRTVSMQVSGVDKSRLPDIKIDNPSSVRSYNDKPHFSTLKNGDVLMTVKQVVIPRHSGNITLPPIRVNWWNSTTNQEKLSRVAGLTMQVAPSDDSQPLPAQAQPSSPEKTKIITKNDAGFWPYLTAAFAILWVLTLLLAYYWKRSTPPAQRDASSKQTSPNTPPNTPFAALKAAILQQDGIAVSQALTQWQQDLELSSEEQAQLDHAKALFDEALYSDTASTKGGESLLQVVKHIEKTARKRRKPTQNVLPPL